MQSIFRGKLASNIELYKCFSSLKWQLKNPEGYTSLPFLFYLTEVVVGDLQLRSAQVKEEEGDYYTVPRSEEEEEEEGIRKLGSLSLRLVA